MSDDKSKGASETTVIKDKTIDLEVPGQTSGPTLRANATNQDAVRQVRVRIIDVVKRKPGGAGSDAERSMVEETSVTKAATPEPSNVLPEDPWSGLALNGKIIEPPFDMLTLTMLVEHNSELGQCIEAMEVNCEATGHRYVSRLKMDAKGNAEGAGDLGKQADAERVMLTNFFTYATRESFTAFRRRVRRDLEATGNAYIEVLRDVDGNIVGFVHIPSYQMRMGILDLDEMLVDRPVLELQLDGSVVAKKRKEWRRFRPFVQTRAVWPASNLRFTTMGYRIRWFKEHLDPRNMDRETGE